MVNSGGLCKHLKISRNCYTCHLEYNYPKEKTQLDTLHETISELKVRVSKLEEYKRLQDDKNKWFEYFYETSHKQYLELDDHRKKQIDENRAISKHLDRLIEEIKNIDESVVALKDWLSEHEQEGSAYGNEFEKRDEDLNKRIKDLEEGYQGLFAELHFLLDKECERQIKKTKGLTFEEAIAAFKLGKKIRREAWDNKEYFLNLKKYEYDSRDSIERKISLIDLADILKDDWEIVE